MATPPPKVLVLATTFPRWKGDSEPPFVWELTRRLQSSGFDCRVLVPHARGAEEFEEWEGVAIRRFRYAPEDWERVCYDGGAFPNLRSSWKARMALPLLLSRQRAWIRRMAEEEEIRLVHSHWIIPQGYWASSVCLRKRIPLLLTAHAGDVFGLRYPLTVPARTALKRSASVTVNSRATGEAVQNLLPGIQPEIIPMGVDLDRFRRSTRSKPFPLEGSPSLLAVGRFAEKKGFHHLLDALPEILDHLPNAHLHLVGFGPWEHRLREQARKREVDDRAHFHGSVPHEEIHRYFAGADLFVQPSVADSAGDREGLGVTIIEAMASGLPVVASASGGIVDLIEPGVHGLLVEPGNVRDLAEKVIRIWTSEGRERMAEAGRCLVEERYSWETIASRFAALYQRLLNL